MGSIDFDPFSSACANAIVRASYYLTPAQSALTHKWRNAERTREFPHGLNVFMNPPFSTPLMSPAVEAFLRALDEGDIAQAIVLVNNATETRWFRRLRQSSYAICFPTHRIAFLAPDGKSVKGNTRGQVFFYYGTAAGSQRFIEHFQAFGWAIHKEMGWNRA
jgi:ParB family chromosome partitioning protein